MSIKRSVFHSGGEYCEEGGAAIEKWGEGKTRSVVGPKPGKKKYSGIERKLFSEPQKGSDQGGKTSDNGNRRTVI